LVEVGDITSQDVSGNSSLALDFFALLLNSPYLSWGENFGGLGKTV
jgi:hypothetical protein